MAKKNYHKPPEGPRTIGGGLKAQGRARREKLQAIINSRPSTVRNDLLPEMHLQTLAIADLKMPKHMVRKLDPGHVKEVANGIQPMGFSGDQGRPRRRAPSARSANIYRALIAARMRTNSARPTHALGDIVVSSAFTVRQMERPGGIY
jgi:hypothetical protein